MQYPAPIATKPVPQQTQPINLSTALNQQPMAVTTATLTTGQQSVGATTLKLPIGQLIIQGGTTSLQVRRTQHYFVLSLHLAGHEKVIKKKCYEAPYYLMFPSNQAVYTI